ncbi:MAG: hypothetical protein GW914_00240, partial [Candidatus Aenigmarchaeota archaeon]|nr:hypothetical protein [Candidatus Aenigmarchaeota archaeon]
MKSLSGLVIALSLMLVFQPVLSQEDLVISPGDGLSTAGALGMFGLILGVIGLILIIPFLIIYIYSALVLSAIAKKTNTENPWFAWVPFLNYVLMARIGKVPVWTAIAFILIIVAEIVVPFFISLPSLINLLILIPVLIIFIVWWMKISEARGKPKWWGILIALIPIVNIVL